MDDMEIKGSLTPSLSHQAVIHWHQLNGGNKGRLAAHALRLLNEAVELCIACGAERTEIAERVFKEFEKATSKNEWGGNPDDIAGECADVSLLLDVVAHYGDVCLQDARITKFEVVLKRDWYADEDGVLWRPR